jgi:hypothetical protein
MPFHESPLGVLVHRIKHFDTVVKRWSGLIQSHEELRRENIRLREHLGLTLRVEGLPHKERMRLLDVRLHPNWEEWNPEGDAAHAEFPTRGAWLCSHPEGWPFVPGDARYEAHCKQPLRRRG